MSFCGVLNIHLSSHKYTSEKSTGFPRVCAFLFANGFPSIWSMVSLSIPQKKERGQPLFPAVSGLVGCSPSRHVTKRLFSHPNRFRRWSALLPVLPSPNGPTVPFVRWPRGVGGKDRLPSAVPQRSSRSEKALGRNPTNTTRVKRFYTCPPGRRGRKAICFFFFCVVGHEQAT